MVNPMFVAQVARNADSADVSNQIIATLGKELRDNSEWQARNQCAIELGQAGGCGPKAACPATVTANLRSVRKLVKLRPLDVVTLAACRSHVDIQCSHVDSDWSGFDSTCSQKIRNA